MASWTNPKNAVDLLSYPPLFSLQEPENKEAQYKVWTDILTAYVLKEKVWSISIQECCMFVNRDINREAPIPLREEIVDYMVKHGRAFWIGSSQRSRAYILRKSVTEYGDLIYNSVGCIYGV
ncbi:hypothetical protein WA538_002887 [Blastocystis sp. DL]